MREAGNRVNRLIRELFFISTACLAVCLLMTTISMFGYDLTQLLPYPPQHWNGSSPEVAFVVPIVAAAVLLYLPAIVTKRLKVSYPPRSGLGLISVGLLIYLAGIMLFMGLHFRGGGPEIHDGNLTIWYKADSVYVNVSAHEYHRAVALVVQFFSAWGMFAFYGASTIYNQWMREGRLGDLG